MNRSLLSPFRVFPVFSFSVLLYVWLVPLQLFAASTLVDWKCEEFGSGCTADIPADGTSGDMSPQSITLPETESDCDTTFFPGVGNIEVSFKATHTRRGDLDVSLTHVPTGITSVLFTDIGGAGQDFDIRINDASSTNISAGQCNNPMLDCTGSYTSESGTFANAFAGINPAGEWKLNVVDDAIGNTGQLIRWSIVIGMFDSDGDSVPDCYDACNGSSQYLDTDKDGIPDCRDECPDDVSKSVAGSCGCGTADADLDADGVLDCDIQASLKKRVQTAQQLILLVKPGVRNKSLRKQVKAAANAIDDFMAASGALVATTDATLDASVLAATATEAMRKAANGKDKATRKKARKSLSVLSAALS